jgi:hypothetical protein
MRIQFTIILAQSHRCLVTRRVYDLPDDEAKQFIKEGVAYPVGEFYKDEPEPMS